MEYRQIWHQNYLLKKLNEGIHLSEQKIIQRERKIFIFDSIYCKQIKLIMEKVNSLNLNLHFITFESKSKMFANEILKEKFTLQQQVELGQNVDFIDGIYSKNNHQDFTFDQYISNQPQQSEDTQLNEWQKEKINFQDQRSHVQSNEVESQQLTILKQHIMTIESIAMKEIQELKAQLLKSQQQKKALQQQLKQTKDGENIVKNQFNQNRLPLETQQTKLMKEQNKMLKQALKQQIQINKKLMKQSMLNLSIQSKENQCNSVSIDQENDKENNSLISNEKIQKSMSNLFEKPSIPHPCQTKRNNLRL